MLAMKINADFSKRAIVSYSDDQWVASPAAGVERLMLDRIGDEVARATSLVRYAPDSRFDRHMHDQGEEFLVLDGVFSDEHADYPAGTYVRNPPGTGHSPHCDKGCVILVKLRQFDADDLEPVVIDTKNEDAWKPTAEGRVCELHRYETEREAMLQFNTIQVQTIVAPEGGLEWLLVNGHLSVDGEKYPALSWFRLPAGDRLKIAVSDDCLVWQKTGHLPSDDAAL